MDLFDDLKERDVLRQRIQRPGQLFIEAGVIDTHSLDLSASGARLQLHQPVQMVVRLQQGMNEIEYTANLVWAKRNDHGQLEYGVEYVSSEKIRDSEICQPLHLRW